MNDKLEQIIEEIYKRYDSRLASEKVLRILNRIRQGGTYRDIYEFIRALGVGDILVEFINASDWVNNRDNYTAVAEAFLQTAKRYSSDIVDLTEIVQQTMYDNIGVGIKPAKVATDTKKLKNIISLALAEDGDPTKLILDLADFGTELTDKIIQANAEIQAESGFKIVIIRRYDDVGIHNYANYSDKRKATHGAEVCQFCKEREGTYEYEETKKNKFVYQRHPKCTCSIDYVNKGFSNRVSNYVR